MRRALAFIVVPSACTASTGTATTTASESWDTAEPFVGFSPSPGELCQWSGTPAKQDALVVEFIPKLAGMSEMVIWSFLYDQTTWLPASQATGLIDSAGAQRPAWDIWPETFG